MNSHNSDRLVTNIVIGGEKKTENFNLNHKSALLCHYNAGNSDFFFLNIQYIVNKEGPGKKNSTYNELIEIASTEHISLGHDVEITLGFRLFFVKLIVLMRFFLHLSLSNAL